MVAGFHLRLGAPNLLERGHALLVPRFHREINALDVQIRKTAAQKIREGVATSEPTSGAVPISPDKTS